MLQGEKTKHFEQSSKCLNKNPLSSLRQNGVHIGGKTPWMTEVLEMQELFPVKKGLAYLLERYYEARNPKACETNIW